MVTCNLCGHPIRMLSSDWTCDQGCNCLMLGCVPRDEKYGTAEPEKAAETNNAALECLKKKKRKNRDKK